jgi:RNA methyltransferase, TrmH family
MLSKSQVKYIRSLGQQKYRKEHNVYLAEGEKLAKEWLQGNAHIKMVIGVEDWVSVHGHLLKRHPEAEVLVATQSELETVSTLQTPNQVMLVVEVPQQPLALPQDEWCIALDNIQDPGNMGTIIRIADWFGIDHIVCSPDCVDVYNPKVVQAGMGGHLRVQLHETELGAFFEQTELPVLAATLHGSDVYDMPKLEKGILLIGNESKGIREAFIERAEHKVTIPRKGGAESLNAGVSTGILCALLLPR